MMQLPATLFAPPADNPTEMSDAALVNARDYWRILFDDPPGFVAAVRAGTGILVCEAEMRRRGMEP